MLSVAARAYLIWQVFDHVHRSPEPVRFTHLKEELEDLEAWPEFRDAALGDPRFLVVGDSIDIATAGVHVSAPVEEIVLQTLDLACVPMTDQTLGRLVRRLRPDLPLDADPVARALATGKVFRPRVGHLARRSWLHGATPIRLPVWLPATPAEAAVEVLAQERRPLSAAGLAAALAERFELSITEAYAEMAGNTALLFLPDGSVSLYDPVTDEIALRRGSIPSHNEDGGAPVPVPGAIEPAGLPPHLVRTVVERCRATRSPITTDEVLGVYLGLNPDDPRYVSTFREVTMRLGLSPDLIPVGQNLWHATAAVPAEVFRRVAESDPRVQGGSRRSVPARPVVRLDPAESRLAGTVLVTVTAAQLGAGCLSDHRLATLLPDHPMLQVLDWSDQDGKVWYNAEHRTLYGLGAWLTRNGVQAGDSVAVTLRDGRLHGTVRRGNVRERSPTAGQWPGRRTRTVTRSLLIAVADILTRAGGSLDRDQLMELLNEEDPWITWAEVEPLFERFPVLRYDRGRCVLVRDARSPVHRTPHLGAVEAEVMTMLSGLPEELRTDPRVRNLARLVAEQPRITAHEEALLLPHAQQARGAEWDRLVTSHLRYALRQLLHRADWEELLPDLEDYFQETVLGLFRAIERFDSTRSPRLQSYVGLWVRNMIDRAKPRYLSPIRLPDHMYWKVAEVLRSEDDVSDVEDEEAGATPEPDAGAGLAEFWAGVEWLDWEPVVAEYEEGGVTLQPLGSAAAQTDFAEETALRSTVDAILGGLSTRDAEVIARRLGLGGREPETLEEIAQSYGLTRERIRQIEKRALGIFKSKLFPDSSRPST